MADQPTPHDIGWPFVGYFCECGRVLEYSAGLWGCGACGTTKDMRPVMDGILQMFSALDLLDPSSEQRVGDEPV